MVIEINSNISQKKRQVQTGRKQIKSLDIESLDIQCIVNVIYNVINDKYNSIIIKENKNVGATHWNGAK